MAFSLSTNEPHSSAMTTGDSRPCGTILVMGWFREMVAATGFANSEELKSAMAKADVSGPPAFWFGEDIEHTPYDILLLTLSTESRKPSLQVKFTLPCG
jgi:hypothetical protein